MKPIVMTIATVLLAFCLGVAWISPQPMADELSLDEVEYSAFFDLEPETKYICKDTIINTPQGCMRIACQKQENCETCCLAWKDLNEDGQIQRKELRCKCKQAPKASNLCKFRRQQVPCPD